VLAYPIELRVAVAAYHEACGSSAETAAEFGCSESWVRRLVQRQRETGSLETLPLRRPDTSKLDAQDLERLRLLIEAKPDLTLAEYAEALGKKVGPPTILRARRKLGYSRKKRPSTPRSSSVLT